MAGTPPYIECLARGKARTVPQGMPGTTLAQGTLPLGNAHAGKVGTRQSYKAWSM